MPVTFAYDRAPSCRTCRGPLQSWFIGASDGMLRCDRCQERFIAMRMRRVFHDVRMELGITRS